MKDFLESLSTQDLVLLVLLAAVPLVLIFGTCTPRIKNIIHGKLEQNRLEKISKSSYSSINITDTDVNVNENENENQQQIQVSGIYVHPVKSLRAISVNSTTFNALGLDGDRTLMLVRQTSSGYRFLTQRQCPALATINASLPTVVKTTRPKSGTKDDDDDDDDDDDNDNDDGGHSHIDMDKKHTKRTMIQLSDEDNKRKIFIDITPSTLLKNPVRYHAGLWDESVEVVDVGDKAAAFIQSILQSSKYNTHTNGGMVETYDDVRVVAQLPKPQQPRRVDGRYCPPSTIDIMGRSPKVSLTDGFPILIASEESLNELNRRLGEKGKDAIPMSRFRPNIVIKGLREAFEEDTWKAIQIGGVDGPIFHIVKGCPRCKQSCTDQLTGERFDEPLVTLGEFRALNPNNKEDVYFAQNVVLQPGSGRKSKEISTSNSIAVGDSVRVLTRGKPVWDIDTVQAE